MANTCVNVFATASGCGKCSGFLASHCLHCFCPLVSLCIVWALWQHFNLESAFRKQQRLFCQTWMSVVCCCERWKHMTTHYRFKVNKTSPDCLFVAVIWSCLPNKPIKLATMAVRCWHSVDVTFDFYFAVSHLFIYLDSYTAAMFTMAYHRGLSRVSHKRINTSCAWLSCQICMWWRVVSSPAFI